MSSESTKKFMSILMSAYVAGYEKGQGKDIQFVDWWASNKEQIKDYFTEATIQVINELKDEYNETIKN